MAYLATEAAVRAAQRSVQAWRAWPQWKLYIMTVRKK